MPKSNNLQQKTKVAIIWNFLEQLGRHGFQFLTTIILAWFLAPGDFGLIAMLAVFFALANALADSGFSQAIIRKKNLEQIDCATAFYSNVILGVVAYLLLFGIAPFVAEFYQEERLTLLIRIVGLTVVFNSFQVIQISILTREMDFSSQLKASLPGTIISCLIAIILAMSGFGVWSLVVQMLVSSMLITLFLWKINQWRPTLEFSFVSLNEMFGFGSKLFISSVIDTLFRNLYVIVIAKIFSATLVGYYFFANKIQETIIQQLSSVVQRVTYPALSTMQEDDIRLKASYRKVIQVLSYIIFPIVLGLVVLAEPLFQIMFNETWLPAVPYLQLLCLAGILFPVHSINLNILKVKGRSDLFLKLLIIRILITSIVLVISIEFGIYGLLVGQIVGSVLCFLPNSYYSKKLINYSITEQVADFVPALVISVGMGVVMYYVGDYFKLDGISKVILLSLLGVVCYIIFSAVFRSEGQALFFKVISERLR